MTRKPALKLPPQLPLTSEIDAAAVERLAKLQAGPPLPLPPAANDTPAPAPKPAAKRTKATQAPPAPAAPAEEPQRRKKPWELHSSERMRQLNVDLPEQLHAKMMHLLYVMNMGKDSRSKLTLREWVAQELAKAADAQLLERDPD